MSGDYFINQSINTIKELILKKPDSVEKEVQPSPRSIEDNWNKLVEYMRKLTNDPS